MEFPHILSPIAIGPVSLSQPRLLPAIDVALHREDHIVDQRYIDFLTSLVENNGIGMIISEFTAVANDQFWAPASRIDKDEFMPGLQGPGAQRPCAGREDLPPARPPRRQGAQGARHRAFGNCQPPLPRGAGRALV